MRSMLKLTAIRNNNNKKIIARRVAADLATDIHRAEALIARLPLDIMRNTPEDKVKQVASDYERLGCVVAIMKDAEPPKDEPPPVVQQPELPPAQHDSSLQVTKKVLSTGFRLHSESEVKKSRIALFFGRDIVRIFMVLIALITVLFLASRCPALKKRTSVKADDSVGVVQESIPVPADTSSPPSPAYTDSGLAAVEERLSDAADPEQKQALKDTLANGYSNKGDFAREPLTKIRFYRMAIAFNVNNEAAWEGLIDALLAEKDSSEAAARVLAEKQKRFFEVDAKLEQVMNSQGVVIDSAIIKKNTLTFSYRSTAMTREEVEDEFSVLKKSIFDVRKFRKVTVTAYQGRKMVTRSWLKE
ncbi:MAG: hypothetical protein JNL74_18970 [Fibrobacteres bacterium]|nr:hypothetical protein [Fibrobacterota bacterium]